MVLIYEKNLTKKFSINEKKLSKVIFSLLKNLLTAIFLLTEISFLWMTIHLKLILNCQKG